MGCKDKGYFSQKQIFDGENMQKKSHFKYATPKFCHKGMQNASFLLFLPCGNCPVPIINLEVYA